MYKYQTLIVLLAGLLFIGQGCASSAEASDQNTSKSDNSSDGSNVGEGGGDIHPRWVLYDSEGRPVKAIVFSPSNKPSDKLQTGDNYSFEGEPNDCVSIGAKGGREFPTVSYELETGKIRPCLNSYRNRFYSNSNCEGTVYARVNRGSVSSYVLEHNGELVWPEGEVQVLQTPYYENSTTGECQKYTPNLDVKLVPFNPIPDWVRNAMPNPPYTVKPAY